jgi:hypothetical protein
MKKTPEFEYEGYQITPVIGGYAVFRIDPRERLGGWFKTTDEAKAVADADRAARKQ